MKKTDKFYKSFLTVLITFSLIFSCCIQPQAFIDNDTNPFLPNANSSWFWSNYEILSDTSVNNAYSPQIDIDSDNNIHVVWYDNTPDLLSSGADIDIFYKVYYSETETWSPLELVSSESDDNSYEPVIAVDSERNVHVAWTDWSDYLGADIDRDVFYKKKNAGGTWASTVVVSSESTISTDEESTIYTDIYDNIYIAWSDSTDILGADGDYDIFLKYYNSTASSWSSLALISTESVASAYKPQIVVNSLSGDVHFVWYDYSDILGADTDGDIFYRRWNVYTTTLSDLNLLNSFSDLNAYNPKIALDQSGDIHVVWADYSEFLDSGINQDVFYKKLYTSSDTWSLTELVSSESRFSTEHPDIVVDKNGFIFATWYDQTEYGGSGTDYDIFFKFKDSSTNQWSVTDVVSVESNSLSHQPEIEVDTFGFVSCVWIEQEDLDSSGTDPDICYRKFAGTPSIPMLSPILPNPSFIGNVSLNWNEILSAEEYVIYRDTSYIWSVSGMEPLTITSDTSLTDNLNETGAYYYAIQALNEYGSSVISNIEFVEITQAEGLFSSLSLTEILIMAGIVLGLQVIVSVITYSLVKGGSSKSKK